MSLWGAKVKLFVVHCRWSEKKPACSVGSWQDLLFYHSARLSWRVDNDLRSEMTNCGTHEVEPTPCSSFTFLGN